MQNLTRCCLPLLLLLACGEERRPPTGPGPTMPRADAGTQPTSNACGNSALNGLEPCDGTLFAGGRECASVGLRTGELRCTAACTLDTSGCEVRDYCTANNLYGNGQCDPCDALGGTPDPDCDVVCGADGTCGDRFDNLTGTWTCRRLNKTDPDCGTCGNGTLDGNELCDDRAFANGKITCTDYGFLGGDLACKRDCSPDFAGCRASRCGDGMKEGPEVCDGTVSDGTTCESRGFAGGMLTCTSSCTVSEASCVRPGCMNNIIEVGRGEECEGSNLNGLTCMSRGFAGGTLACDGTCRYDETGCVAMGCNNQIREPSEECEGSDLNGQSCMSQGFLSGTLGCSSTSCTFDTSQCIAPGCGNTIIEPNEQCEGQNLNGKTCLTENFAGGTLTCNSMCQLDTSQCVARGCMNNIIEPSEQCEGANLNNSTCTTIGFLGGTLSCDQNCRFDTTQCTRGGCGNGVLEPASEQCDGAMLGAGTCASQGFSGGTLSCNGQCRYDTSLCTGGGTGSVCGDGRVTGLELCDGANYLAGLDRNCSALGLGAGMIGCRNCRLDFATCGTPDYCGAQSPSFYGDGACDYCQLGGGMADSVDCGTPCTGSDGMCVDYYSDLGMGFTCVLARGSRDPDCGCGDGFLQPVQMGASAIEQCEGTQFNYSQNCVDYGFTSGTVRCNAHCGLDFANCR